MVRLVLAAAVLCSQMAFASDIAIVDVRRNIPLSDEEPAYTDFYISGGESEGLKKNLVVTVFRQINVRDFSGATSFGEIQVPVGQVRIIATYGKVSVGREYKLLSRDDNPMLEQIGIMSGDRITTKGSFVDNKPKRKPQATAQATPAPAPAIQTAVVVVPAAPAAPAPVNAAAPAATPPAVANPAGVPVTPAAPTAKAPAETTVPDALLESPVNNSAPPTATGPSTTVIQ